MSFFEELKCLQSDYLIERKKIFENEINERTPVQSPTYVPSTKKPDFEKIRLQFNKNSQSVPNLSTTAKKLSTSNNSFNKSATNIGKHDLSSSPVGTPTPPSPHCPLPTSPKPPVGPLPTPSPPAGPLLTPSPPVGPLPTAPTPPTPPSPSIPSRPSLPPLNMPKARVQNDKPPIPVKSPRVLSQKSIRKSKSGNISETTSSPLAMSSTPPLPPPFSFLPVSSPLSSSLPASRSPLNSDDSFLRSSRNSKTTNNARNMEDDDDYDQLPSPDCSSITSPFSAKTDEESSFSFDFRELKQTIERKTSHERVHDQYDTAIERKTSHERVHDQYDTAQTSHFENPSASPLPPPLAGSGLVKSQSASSLSSTTTSPVLSTRTSCNDLALSASKDSNSVSQEPQLSEARKSLERTMNMLRSVQITPKPSIPIYDTLDGELQLKQYNENNVQHTEDYLYNPIDLNPGTVIEDEQSDNISDLAQYNNVKARMPRHVKFEEVDRSSFTEYAVKEKMLKSIPRDQIRDSSSPKIEKNINIQKMDPKQAWVSVQRSFHSFFTNEKDGDKETDDNVQAIVLHDWEPAPDLTGELHLCVGETITVSSRNGPWWTGRKNGFVGTFPRDCVKIIAKDVGDNTHGLERRKTFKTRKSFVKAKSFSGKKSATKSSVFGINLTAYCQSRHVNCPVFLTMGFAYIEEHGITQGIYRQSGSTSDIARIRDMIEKCNGDYLDVSAIGDVHTISNVLKQFCRELEAPIIPFYLHDQFLEASDILSVVSFVARVTELIWEMSNEHYAILYYIITHLHRLAKFSNETNMDSNNLSIVWGLNLSRREFNLDPLAGLKDSKYYTNLCRRLIDNCSEIFVEPPQSPEGPPTSVLLGNKSTEKEEHSKWKRRSKKNTPLKQQAKKGRSASFGDEISSPLEHF